MLPSGARAGPSVSPLLRAIFLMWILSKTAPFGTMGFSTNESALAEVGQKRQKTR